MALAITRKEVITKRHEWRIPSPATYADVQKAITFASNHRHQKGLETYDDSILVEASDYEVIIYWTEEKK